MSADVDLNDLNDLRDKAISKIPDALDHLPEGTLENLPSFNTSNIPSIEEGEELLKEKCDRNGNNESYDNAMVSVIYFVQLDVLIMLFVCIFQAGGRGNVFLIG